MNIGRLRLLVAGCALLAGCTFFAGCQAKIKGRNAIAGPATIRDGVRLSGTAEPVDSVDIKPEVSGRIVKVLVSEGDTVRPGQLLLQIDTVPFILARNTSRLQVGRTQLALATAQRDLARANSLDSTGSVSKDQLQDLQVAVKNAALNLSAANLALQSSNLDLLHTHIVSPMAGVLITFSVAVGTVASSAEGINGGTNLGTIADPSRLKVVVEVGELDYPRLVLGMPVQISTEGAVPRSGHISFIPSSARASTDTKTIMVFPLEAVLDSSSKGLMPGMTVGVDFVFLQKKVAVAIPYESIQTGSSTSGDTSGSAGTVLVKDPKGVLVSKPIRIGVTDYRNTEVRQGLSAGDTVWIPDSAQQSDPSKNAGGASSKPGAKGGAI